MSPALSRSESGWRPIPLRTCFGILVAPCLRPVVGVPGMLVALTGLLWLTRQRWKGFRVGIDFGN